MIYGTCIMCGENTEYTVTMGIDDTHSGVEYFMCLNCVLALIPGDHQTKEKIHQANLEAFERELRDD